MHKILVIRLYFPLDALHVSGYVSPSSGATFYKLYIVFGISRYHTSGCCVAIAKVTYKDAPDDGLIWSETRRASNRK